MRTRGSKRPPGAAPPGGDGVTDVETRIRAVLAEVYYPTGVDIIMTSPHRHFGGRVPGEMIADGQGEEVLEYMEYLVGGAW